MTDRVLVSVVQSVGIDKGDIPDLAKVTSNIFSLSVILGFVTLGPFHCA